MKESKRMIAGSIQDYLDCGAYYGFRNFGFVQPEHIDGTVLFSTALYTAISKFHHARAAGESISLSKFLMWFTQFWIEKAENNPLVRFDDGTDFVSLYWQGQLLIEAYYKEYPLDEFAAYAVEQPFSCGIDGITVQGVVDLIERDLDGNLVVSEFIPVYTPYDIGSVEKHVELVLGCMALRDNRRDQKLFRRIDCFVQKPQIRFDQWFAIQNPEEERRAVELVFKARDGIQAGVFASNMKSWRCERCGYHVQCG